MTDVSGTWDCVMQTPMGDQASVMVLAAAGSAVTGTSTSMLGTAELRAGCCEGDRLTWEMDISMPFPMTLKGDVRVTGDHLEGQVSVGMFGSSAIRGERRKA
jgi:hypothetical protein